MAATEALGQRGRRSWPLDRHPVSESKVQHVLIGGRLLLEWETTAWNGLGHTESEGLCLPSFAFWRFDLSPVSAHGSVEYDPAVLSCAVSQQREPRCRCLFAAKESQIRSSRGRCLGLARQPAYYPYGVRDDCSASASSILDSSGQGGGIRTLI